MDPILLVLLLVIVGVGAWFVYTRQRALPPAGGATRPEPTPPGGASLRPDLQALKPGDAVSFWDGTDATVQGSLDCREDLGGRSTEWRWVFLSGDKVLELPPQGQALYDRSAVAYQGDEFYELLVGAGGALKRFEANVREGIAHEPVQVEIDGVTYRIRSTGTFAATRIGELPGDGEVWAGVSANPADNVYFKMVPAEATEGREIALGVWTTHIVVLTGRSLDRHEITNVFAV
ncbi:MAG TPA: hypothetical protein VG370_17315 [Chloroflexota bacterium]|nr:hypothetical protein [Chloroflexota bacterium]